nr:PrgI family protein [uncultured Sellimonas sp.]
MNITKDLTEVKSKVVFGLTQRQLIFFALAALVAVPTYFLTRKSLGNDIALILLIVTALPFFFFALYEKNGQTPEKMLRNYFRVRFLTQQARPYRTENRFAALERQAYFDEEVKQLVSNTEKTGAETGRGLGRRVAHPAGHTAECRAEKATGKGHQAGKTRR